MWSARNQHAFCAASSEIKVTCRGAGGTGSAPDLLHGRLERRPTKSDILYMMTHFEDNISVLRSQGITLPYYGTVVQARASGARHWLALPVCHAKLAQQPDKAKIEHVHQALIMRLRQSPSVDCWTKAGHSSIARAFQIVPTNDTQSTVR